MICAVHSFTPRLRGRPQRPWQVGILSAWDRRLADPLLALLRGDGALAAWAEGRWGGRWCVGDNQPYTGHLPGDSIDRHALRHGRLNLLLELRNDLIATPQDQAEWAARLAPLLTRALEAAEAAGAGGGGRPG